MLFNSLDFAVFLPVFFLLYWFGTQRNLRAQNLLIVAGSYLFYGWWDWRFLSLIIFSTALDFILGKKLSTTQNERKRKRLLICSLVVNLGFLGVFKYFNFFVDNFVDAFSLFGMKINSPLIEVILPVGISFYTFQTLSYTIDVYKKELEAAKDFVAFSAFVSFFPQLVAGPIERATNLLPQFYKKRVFDRTKAVDGGRQILWGFFKKVVIADNCAPIVNDIFANYGEMSSVTLMFGAILFAFQIYGDFSGYSDIAIGSARLFGFELKRNFAFPYFSRDTSEFWRRWHISLSTWFRDYVYIPLGGSKGNNWFKFRNTMIIFIVSGFWHGANWTFIVWGALNAIFFLPLMMQNKNRNNLGTVAEGRLFAQPKDIFKIVWTFSLITFAWIFFRADNMEHAIGFIKRMVSVDLFGIPEIIPIKEFFFVGILIVVEWIGREGQYGISYLQQKGGLHRMTTYYIIMALILLFGNFESNQFIYFQF